jgi:hypothetical protein
MLIIGAFARRKIERLSFDECRQGGGMGALPFGRRSLVALGLTVALGVTAAAYLVSPVVSSPAAPFAAENRAAMDKMMAGMAIKASDDADQDFAAMMIPHHQGAIDMAQAELRYGRNEQLRRIAQEIIVDQQQEIAAMRLALGQNLPPSVAAPDQPAELLAEASQATPAVMTICKGSPK